jgi:hypothetical protein
LKLKNKIRAGDRTRRNKPHSLLGIETWRAAATIADLGVGRNKPHSLLGIETNRGMYDGNAWRGRGRNKPHSLLGIETN